MSTCRPCLVHQCGTPDSYRSGDIDYAIAVIVEVTTTEKTKVGNTCGIQSWNLVSERIKVIVDHGEQADCSYSTIGTSCARLYPLSVMVGGGDMTSKYITLDTPYNI